MSGHQVCHTEPEEGNSAVLGRSSEQILDTIIQLTFYMPHTWAVTLCRATRMRWIFTSLSLKFIGFPGDSVGKNLRTNAQEMQFQPLGREDLLEEKMATHSSILAWEIPWTEDPGGLQSMRSQTHPHINFLPVIVSEAPCFSPLRKTNVHDNFGRRDKAVLAASVTAMVNKCPGGH